MAKRIIRPWVYIACALLLVAGAVAVEEHRISKLQQQYAVERETEAEMSASLKADVARLDSAYSEVFKRNPDGEPTYEETMRFLDVAYDFLLTWHGVTPVSSAQEVPTEEPTDSL